MLDTKMKKNIALAILSLLNIGFITYFIISKEPPRQKPYLFAIELAKNAATLGDRTITNHDYILSKIKNIKGVLNIEGWKAKKINDSIFLVQYKYDKPNLSWYFDSRYIFEVNVKQELVRNVIGDYELEELYEIIDRKEKFYKICYKNLMDAQKNFFRSGVLTPFDSVPLYRSFIDLVRYNHTNNLEFEYDPIIAVTRKPFIEALLDDFSDKSEGNNRPEIYVKDYGENIYEYHETLINILNIASQNALD